jgi:hypothetical protein
MRKLGKIRVEKKSWMVKMELEAMFEQPVSRGFHLVCYSLMDLVLLIRVRPRWNVEMFELTLYSETGSLLIEAGTDDPFF